MYFFSVLPVELVNMPGSTPTFEGLGCPGGGSSGSWLPCWRGEDDTYSKHVQSHLHVRITWKCRTFQTLGVPQSSSSQVWGVGHGRGYY